MTAMQDAFGRSITYLRVSVTDLCDFRCLYCMAEGMTFLPKSEVLSLEELNRLCGLFVAAGVRKLRLTGGEPLVRRGIIGLVRSLGGLLGRGLDELALTTNGARLDRFAGDLKAAGVRRVNVSLDSLDADTFAGLTRRGRLADVLRGIKAAVTAGLKVKINTVAVAGVNEGEFDRLVAWCGERDFDLTFIEAMPMGDTEGYRADRHLSLGEVRSRLERSWTLSDAAETTGGPARYVRVSETGGRVGFIAPMSHNFCATCNRVRLTCTGRLYLCLGQEDRVDLRAPLRAGAGDEELHRIIAAAVAGKPRGHDFVTAPGQGPVLRRAMSVTGG